MTSIPQLLTLPRDELLREARSYDTALRPRLGDDELAATIAVGRLAHGDPVHTDGVLAVLPEGFGFVRLLARDLQPSAVDAFVSPSQVRSLNLQDGHRLAGSVRAPRGGERYFALTHIDAVQGTPPEALDTIAPFDEQPPIVPGDELALATELPSLQALQQSAPWCRGHRVLVHAPAGWSCAPWFADLADALRAATPDSQITLCLLDQQPERLAEARRRAARAGWDCVGTSFASAPEQSTLVAAMALERARRQVEHGGDAVLLLDSLTALTVAAGRSGAPSGAWVQPGLDVRALQPGKRLFASARALASGGALTVVAAAQIGDPASLTAAIAAEFAPASNSDVVLTPDATDDRKFDPTATRTRPECLARRPRP